jgi:hypothetical protein
MEPASELFMLLPAGGWVSLLLCQFVNSLNDSVCRVVDSHFQNPGPAGTRDKGNINDLIGCHRTSFGVRKNVYLFFR